MARTREPNFLRAWREHRGLTQAKLAEAVDTTGAVISLLEAGERGLSDKWLRRLAPVLGTTPGHLLDMNPNDANDDVMEIFAAIPKERQEQARNVLKALRDPAPEVAPPFVVPRAAATPRSESAQQPKTRRGGQAKKGI